MNPYQVLGVSYNATEAEIKKAYRRLSRKYHPDSGGDPAKFDEVNKAYNMISGKRGTVKVMRKRCLRHVSLFTFAVSQ